MAMAFQLFHLPLASSSSSSSTSSTSQSISVVLRLRHYYNNSSSMAIATTLGLHHRRRRRKRASRCRGGHVLASKEDTTELSVSLPDPDDQQLQDDPTPEDLEYDRQIQRVLELLKKNRDMLFSEEIKGTTPMPRLISLLEDSLC